MQPERSDLRVIAVTVTMHDPRDPGRRAGPGERFRHLEFPIGPIDLSAAVDGVPLTLERLTGWGHKGLAGTRAWLSAESPTRHYGVAVSYPERDATATLEGFVLTFAPGSAGR